MNNGIGIELTNEIFEARKHEAQFIRDVNFAHGCADQHGTHLHYKAFGDYPEYYTFNDTSFIKQASVIYGEMKDARLKAIENSDKIHFVAMGGDIEVDDDNIPNHRIRTEFYNDRGRQFFIEVCRFSETASFHKNKMHIDFSIDRTAQLRAKNTCSVGYNYDGLEREYTHPHTMTELLHIVNTRFGCSYKGVVIENHFVSTDDFINSVNK